MIALDYQHLLSFFNTANSSGPYIQYSLNRYGSVPIGVASQSSPTLTLTFNTNTGTYTSG